MQGSSAFVYGWMNFADCLSNGMAVKLMIHCYIAVNIRTTTKRYGIRSLFKVLTYYLQVFSRPARLLVSNGQKKHQSQ